MPTERDRTVSDWRITVDRGSCIRSELCTTTAPHHFTIEDGRSKAIQAETAPDDVVVDAAEACPAEAIRVYDAATDRQIAPED